MILYRVQHAETGIGPFVAKDHHATGIWYAGPTPCEDGLGEFEFVAGRACAVAEPALLPRWFRAPHSLRAWGFVLTVWDAPDDTARRLAHQALFDKDAATLIRTIPLPEQWEDILDLLDTLPEV